MADKIQIEDVGIRAGVASELMRRNDEDEGGEFALQFVGQGWTVARKKGDYPIYLDVRGF